MFIVTMITTYGGELKIDILDPDTEEKKFKEGDSIKHNGKEYVVGKDLGDDIHKLSLKSSKMKKAFDILGVDFDGI